MRASEPVSGSVAPMRISDPDGAAAAVEPPDGCCAWSVDGCLHAPSASAQRAETKEMARMARSQTTSVCIVQSDRLQSCSQGTALHGTLTSDEQGCDGQRGCR